MPQGSPIAVEFRIFPSTERVQDRLLQTHVREVMDELFVLLCETAFLSRSPSFDLERPRRTTASRLPP